ELKVQGYPIFNSYTHLDMMRRGLPEYRCHWPKYLMPIEANGDVVDCMHWGEKTLGNVREQPFAEILKSPRLRELAGPVGEACHKCVSLHRVEISEICEGRVEPLLAWVSALAPEGWLPTAADRIGRQLARRGAGR
ncbi:MAG: SPASM domain-containing protein, partial [Deltaproteobacteria bacterium]|nr:SPASM domain-containing protein [Deltaproteobacteria bacterium]